jgi:hypothetical protein
MAARTADDKSVLMTNSTSILRGAGSDSSPDDATSDVVVGAGIGELTTAGVLRAPLGLP